MASYPADVGARIGAGKPGIVAWALGRRRIAAPGFICYPDQRAPLKSEHAAGPIEDGCSDA
jgi:hypothetical protein